MSVVHVERAYLESPYLENEYLTTQVDGALGSQFNFTIDYQVAFAAQLQAQINAVAALAGQLEAIISRGQATGVQSNFVISDVSDVVAFQYSANIDTVGFSGIQFEGFLTHGKWTGAQYQANVLNRLSALAKQFNADISQTPIPIAIQAEGVIDTATALASQMEFNISEVRASGIQFEASVIDYLEEAATQFQGIINTVNSIPTQYFAYTVSEGATPLQFSAGLTQPSELGLQFNGQYLDKLKAYPFQFTVNSVFHQWDGYLLQPYLQEAYLVKMMHARAGTQYDAVVLKQTPTGLQFHAHIVDKNKAIPVQVKFVINDKPQALGVQFDGVFPWVLPTQFRSALYNNTNLRVLYEFPSRGTGVGGNWTANSTASGDFDVSNLNTDIVEQVWRTNGLKVGVKLECDTGLAQGVYIDTFAMLNHNLTTSATVLLEGDDDPSFGSPGFSKSITMSNKNSYWIAESLPIEGFRYWRVSIDDPTNPESYLEIGSIVFGSSVIFAGECFSNPVRLTKKHFSDKVYTEGFTNVSNDRTVKKSLSLTFQNLEISGGNFTNLTLITDTIKTNLKALWIPTPKYPSRYAVFGKLAQIPEEEHNDLGENADYVNLNIDVDESL